MNEPANSRVGATIGYWTLTVLVAFAMGSGGIADAMRIPPVVEGMTHLGYPLYFCVILGVWKILGAIAILMPRTPLIKEWAYAGIFFDLTGAAASHLSVGDDATKIIAPVVLTLMTVGSWYLRPSSRRFACTM